MDRSFSASFHSDPELNGQKMVFDDGEGEGTGAARDEATEDGAHGDGANPTIRFGQGGERGGRDVRGQGSGGGAGEEQIDNGGEAIQEGVGGFHAPRKVLKMLHTETVAAGGGSFGESTKRVADGGGVDPTGG
ncbi:hypothetical protein HDU96_004948 [Phlyctochytrium bullatum]|nr:hypothetical protein HDU96_004948 [Phlyctochytrium bullatum]